MWLGCFTFWIQCCIEHIGYSLSNIVWKLDWSCRFYSFSTDFMYYMFTAFWDEQIYNVDDCHIWKIYVLKQHWSLKLHNPYIDKFKYTLYTVDFHMCNFDLYIGEGKGRFHVVLMSNLLGDAIGEDHLLCHDMLQFICFLHLLFSCWYIFVDVLFWRCGTFTYSV